MVYTDGLNGLKDELNGLNGLHFLLKLIAS